jgi:hypothetical protein
LFAKAVDLWLCFSSLLFVCVAAMGADFLSGFLRFWAGLNGSFDKAAAVFGVDVWRSLFDPFFDLEAMINLPLPANTEFADQGPIAFLVLILNVSQQTLPCANHLHQAMPGSVVFLIVLQVFTEAINPLSQHGDLNI